jgi:polyvinyl alcohol dehydrogenase (cytochrome)
VAVALVAIAVTFLAAAGALAGQDSWSMSGQGITNWRFQPGETDLAPGNVGSLVPAWVATLAGDISATPAVVDGEVYVPDWGGKIWKLDAKTGDVIWSKSVATITGIPDTGFPRPISRTSPAVVNDVVVFGSQSGAWLIALKRTTGEVKWKTQLDAHPTAVVTQSPTVPGPPIPCASLRAMATTWMPSWRST